MKIVWSEKGLCTAWFITRIIIIVAGAVLGVSLFASYLYAGAFEEADETNIILSADENRAMEIKLFVWVGVSVLSFAIWYFSKYINGAINNKLERIWTEKQKQFEERCAERAAANADYAELLNKYASVDETAEENIREENRA